MGLLDREEKHTFAVLDMSRTTHPANIAAGIIPHFLSSNQPVYNVEYRIVTKDSVTITAVGFRFNGSKNYGTANFDFFTFSNPLSVVNGWDVEPCALREVLTAFLLCGATIYVDFVV